MDSGCQDPIAQGGAAAAAVWNLRSGFLLQSINGKHVQNSAMKDTGPQHQVCWILNPNNCTVLGTVLAPPPILQDGALQPD